MSVELHLGDCLDVLRTLPDNSVDAVVTSPPYAMQRAAFYGGIVEGAYPEWTVAWMAALQAGLSERASVLVNIREHVRDGQISDYVHQTRLALRGNGWIECDELIWVKPDAPPVGHPYRPRRAWERILWFSRVRQPACYPKANGRQSEHVGMTGGKPGWVHARADGQAGIARCRDIVEVPTSCNERGGEHPAAYPVPLAEWMVRLVTEPGSTVLDPFMGSGTTGVACVQTGRNFIGIEIDETYYRIAQQRIAEAQMQPSLWEVT